MSSVTRIDLKNNAVTFVLPGFLAAMHRVTILLTNNPTASCNLTAQNCQCAKDQLSGDPSALLSQGSKGDACLCPAGSADIPCA